MGWEVLPSAEVQSVYSIALGNTQINVKTVVFQIIQFSISTQFKCQNSSILNHSV